MSATFSHSLFARLTPFVNFKMASTHEYSMEMIENPLTRLRYRPHTIQQPPRSILRLA